MILSSWSPGVPPSWDREYWYSMKPHTIKLLGTLRRPHARMSTQAPAARRALAPARPRRQHRTSSKTRSARRLLRDARTTPRRSNRVRVPFSQARPRGFMAAPMSCRAFGASCPTTRASSYRDHSVQQHGCRGTRSRSTGMRGAQRAAAGGCAQRAPPLRRTTVGAMLEAREEQSEGESSSLDFSETDLAHMLAAAVRRCAVT